jgi:ubiquinone/menaquinone biosynthesis C-methylase UbiE
MARIAYDDLDAAAFVANRHVDDDGLTAWREAVARHLNPKPGLRLLDLGAGTGWWASAFCRWYDGIDVIAIEPSAAMRARRVYPRMVAGDAANIPLADGSVDAAWLSTVIHHLPDLGAVAGELRRVLRPGGTVLIRSGFPGRSAGITLFRFFPEAIRVVDSYPSMRAVETAFGDFTTVAFEAIRQTTAPSLRDAAADLRRAAHTPLQLITDDEYAAGLARLHRAAEVESGPVIDALDLLVLRST